MTRPDGRNRSLRSADADHDAVAGDGGRDTPRPPGEAGRSRDGPHGDDAHPYAPATPAGFGAERCPAVWLARDARVLDDAVPVGWVEVARVDAATTSDPARWRLAGYVDAPTDGLLAADAGDEPVAAAVYGTREGDRWSGPVRLATLAPGPTDVWAVELAVGDTAGTIFRWWATGCLACRDAGRCGE